MTLSRLNRRLLSVQFRVTRVHKYATGDSYPFGFAFSMYACGF